jgi:hypothetical protein
MSLPTTFFIGRGGFRFSLDVADLNQSFIRTSAQGGTFVPTTKYVYVKAWGAGGANEENNAGTGGYIQGWVEVTPNASYTAFVGAKGDFGTGGRAGVGGGGFSGLFLGNTHIISAGGGGGSSGQNVVNDGAHHGGWMYATLATHPTPVGGLGGYGSGSSETNWLSPAGNFAGGATAAYAQDSDGGSGGGGGGWGFGNGGSGPGAYGQHVGGSGGAGGGGGGGAGGNGGTPERTNGGGGGGGGYIGGGGGNNSRFATSGYGSGTNHVGGGGGNFITEILDPDAFLSNSNGSAVDTNGRVEIRWIS